MPRLISYCVTAALLCGCNDGSQKEISKLPHPSDATPKVAQDNAASPPNEPTSAPVAVSAPLQQNRYLKLMATEAGFVDPAGHAALPGQRYYAVGLRGTSRSRNAVVIDIARFVYAQNDQGCISRPEVKPTWLPHPFGEIAEFSQSQMTDGQLAFPLPADSKQVRVLIVSSDEQALTVPAGRDFTPSWPTPVNTIEDGSTMRVMVLPRPDPPPALPSPANGYDRVVLDFAVENLNPTQGIEFQTSQQLRLRDSSGSFVQPAPATSQLGCRLDDGDVIPPGTTRRFMVAYDMPAGMPLSLQYRGFELEEANVDLQ